MILIHLDVGSLLEKLRLRVTADLSVTLVMPHRSEIILTDRVSSMEELYASMRKAESLTICCGTLFDENRYATQCSGIITPNENYQRQQLNPRCRACRILRQRIQANMRYKRDSTLAFRIKRKKEIYRQRCHRLIKKMNIIISFHFERDNFEYDYLMTSRLSQDPLERFFSIMRNSCGSNDHPDPKLFGQVFRLVSCFSLVRPPKDCNVSGPQLLSTLMQTQDSLYLTQRPRKEWLNKIDELLEDNFENEERDCVEDDITEHDYCIFNTSDEVQAFIAGYITKKMQILLRYEDCKLLYKQRKMNGTMNIVGTSEVQIDTLHDILKEAGKQNLPHVGCESHEHEVTSRVIDNNYIRLREVTKKIELLRQNNAKIDAIDAAGRTPFLSACDSGNLEAVKYPINNNANIHPSDSEK
ncbi:uncharacterized protein [Chelonus insularis]|uniref:uncharacterized protein n=1 Tax=Chelonus insularis TaxID=460826 RepID=UPI0015898EFB|nr:uncharacterized protein LOC118070407 [Chelonus insularis]